MTKTQALYEFYSSFGLKAYPVDTVPSNVALPYLTYELSFGDSEDVTVRMYFYTESEEMPNQKAITFCDSIGRGGVNLPYEEESYSGNLWITLGSQSWYASTGEEDSNIKERTINLVISDEY